MTDSELVRNFLTREYTNNHPVIGIFMSNDIQSQITAIETVKSLVYTIFKGGVSESLLLETIKDFLENKKKQYLNGEFNIQRLY